MSALSVGGRQPAEFRRFHSFFPPFSKGGWGGFLCLRTMPARHQSPLAPLYQGGDRSRGPRLGAEPTPNADRAFSFGREPVQFLGGQSERRGPRRFPKRGVLTSRFGCKLLILLRKPVKLVPCVPGMVISKPERSCDAHRTVQRDPDAGGHPTYRFRSPGHPQRPRPSRLP